MEIVVLTRGNKSISFHANNTEAEKAVIAALAELSYVELEGSRVNPLHEEADETHIEFHELSYEELRRMDGYGPKDTNET